MLALILLAVLQGLTEFLPVSSSGHLLLARKLVGLETGWWSAFDVSVHVGTLLAVFVFFRRDFLRVLKAIPGFCSRVFAAKTRPAMSPEERLVGCIVLATLPTALIGFGVNEFIMKQNVPLWFVGIGFLITSSTLFILGRTSGDKGLGKLTAPDAFFAGLMQGLATLPGISRSGFTITALLMRGMDGDAAVRFSFLAATPAIIGAAALKVLEVFRSNTALHLGQLACGALVAAVVGYIALVLLVGVLRRRWFGRFAWYLVPLGVVTLILSFVLQK